MTQFILTFSPIQIILYIILALNMGWRSAAKILVIAIISTILIVMWMKFIANNF